MRRPVPIPAPGSIGLVDTTPLRRVARRLLARAAVVAVALELAIPWVGAAVPVLFLAWLVLGDGQGHVLATIPASDREAGYPRG